MSKSKKRRGRPKIDGPRETNGRLVRKASRADKEKAMMAVVETRCRALGIWPEPIVRVWGEPADSLDARKAARLAQIRAAMALVGLPWMGSNVGRRIAGDEDAAELWQVATMIQARHRAYQRAIDAPRQAGVMSMMVAPDRQTAGDAVEPVAADVRSEEERAASAIAAWERLGVPADLLEALLSDQVPQVFPLATRLREVKERVDGEAPEPVAKGLGQSLVDVAARAYVIECSIMFPGGKTTKRSRVVAGEDVDKRGLGLLAEEGDALMASVAQSVRGDV